MEAETMVIKSLGQNKAGKYIVNFRLRIVMGGYGSDDVSDRREVRVSH